MVFIVENGTNVPNANSYVDVEYSKEYFANRLITEWASYTDEQIQARLIIATQYADMRYSGKFKGDISYDDQSLAFPRDLYFTEVDDIKTYIIPSILKNAICEYAMSVDGETMSLTTAFATSDTSGEIKRKKEVVGALETETEYFSSSTNGTTIFTTYVMADGLIKPLLRSTNLSRCIRA